MGNFKYREKGGGIESNFQKPHEDSKITTTVYIWIVNKESQGVKYCFSIYKFYVFNMLSQLSNREKKKSRET